MPTIHCENCHRLLQFEDGYDAPWLTCPVCLHKNPNPSAPFFQERLPGNIIKTEREAEYDLRSTVICLTLFGVVGLVGLTLFITQGGFDLIHASRDGAEILGVGILLISFIMVGAVSLIISSHSKTTKLLSAILGSMGLILSGAVVILLLALCAVFSAVAAFFETCGNCGK